MRVPSLQECRNGAQQMAARAVKAVAYPVAAIGEIAASTLMALSTAQMCNTMGRDDLDAVFAQDVREYQPMGAVWTPFLGFVAAAGLALVSAKLPAWGNRLVERIQPPAVHEE